MKNLFPILVLSLFTFQCERGWLNEILNPTVLGCKDSTSCNYNSDADEDDGSCLTNDCAGVCGGTSIIDSCNVCGGTVLVVDDCPQCDDGLELGCDGICSESPKTIDACGVCGGDGVCDDGETDTILPSATILSPASGATVSEITTIEVYATDNVGIQKIEFYIADELKFTDTESPYEYEWNTSSYSDGVDYTLIVRAYDFAGNMTIVAPILLTVDNTSSYPALSTLYARYENGNFLLSWTQNDDSDFSYYALYESIHEDMTDSTIAFNTAANTPGSNTMTSHEIFGIGENERRYYRLIITDTIGLKSASNLQIASSYQLIIFKSDGKHHLIDIEGHLITQFDWGSQEWKFTPDGKKIICVDFPDYYVINIDGTGKRNITENLSESVYGTEYRISPDGTKVLFESGEDIWTANIDGSGVTQLTNSTDYHDQYPDFSPDGQSIVFERLLTGDNSPLDGIFIMNADGSNVTNVIYEHATPHFAPSGSQIVYEGYWDNVGLWIIDIDGSNQLKLTTTLTFSDYGTDSFIFTPDGQSIVYRTGKSDYSVAIINIDGTGETILSEDSHQPTVTSDGKIVFVKHIDSNTDHLKIMNTDGSDEQVIYEGNRGFYYPSAQPIP